MSADQLVAAIRDNGGSLRLVEGSLRLGKLKALPAGIAEAVREKKPAIVALLEKEFQLIGGTAIDALNRAGVRLPELPGGRRVLAAPRSNWSPSVANALGLLGYAGLPVVLLDRRYELGDSAMTEAAWKKVRTGEFFGAASEVDPAVRWFAPVWPERLSVGGQVSCSQCAHFVADAAGCGGVGACKIGGEGIHGRIPLYPNARRHCRDYRSFE